MITEQNQITEQNEITKIMKRRKVDRHCISVSNYLLNWDSHLHFSALLLLQKCYWTYTKKCYITEQSEITETSVIAHIS
jgi:hypothetical protein